MAAYKLQYWFEWGGTCLWSANEAARERYGYAVDEQELPLSGNLKRYLAYLQAYYQTRMDWDRAPAASPWWTEEDTRLFRQKAQFSYRQLRQELGEDYEIEYKLV